jgi:hypothetical protein
VGAGVSDGGAAPDLARALADQAPLEAQHPVGVRPARVRRGGGGFEGAFLETAVAQVDRVRAIRPSLEDVFVSRIRGRA